MSQGVSICIYGCEFDRVDRNEGVVGFGVLYHIGKCTGEFAQVDCVTGLFERFHLYSRRTKNWNEIHGRALILLRSPYKVLAIPNHSGAKLEFDS